MNHNISGLATRAATRTPIIIAPVRLIGGSSANQGRVEIKHRGQWGTVCDDSWDILDAHVVCRQLGYTEAVEVRSGTKFDGQSSGPILMDNVVCKGYESALSMCSFNGWLQTNCVHEEDVGVVCSDARLPGKVMI